jgi:hypothetical protein
LFFHPLELDRDFKDKLVIRYTTGIKELLLLNATSARDRKKTRKGLLVEL